MSIRHHVRAAEWALSIGGNVEVSVVNVGRQAVAKIDDLPQRPFHVMNINIGGKPAVDEDLARLQQLRLLENLVLADTQVTDAGLEHLRGLTQLVSLGLSNTRVSDGGLQLQELRNLRTLELNGTEVTEDGLRQLRELKSLSTIELSDRPFTANGTEHLNSLPYLTNLTLAGPDVTDANVKNSRLLRDLDLLHGLALEDTQVTDAGLEVVVASHRHWYCRAAEDSPELQDGLGRSRPHHQRRATSKRVSPRNRPNQVSIHCPACNRRSV